MGNQIAHQLKNPTGLVTKSQTRTFDAFNRLREMIHGHGGKTIYQYDGEGNQIGLIDELNRESLQTYDALNRIVLMRDTIQGQTTYTYDTHDNITSVTDPEGQITTYVIDDLGNHTSMSSPDTGSTTSTYDEAGNQLTKTDARGITTSFSYDALDRMLSISYPSSTENITYVYDEGVYGKGRLSSISDQSGITSYSYDARGNTVAVTRSIGGQSYTVNYGYNGADRLINMTYPSGRQITFHYDASGRISQITSDHEGTSEVLADSITRLPFGPATGMTLGNGISRTRQYDSDYRVENITDGSVLSRSYAYNAVNNISAITDSIDPNLTQFFSYDDLDRLIFATGDYGELNYTYDGVGNRLTLERAGTDDDGSVR